MERNSLVRGVLILVGLAAGVYLANAAWHVVGNVFNILMMVFFAWMIATAITHIAAGIRRRTHLQTGASVGLAYLVVFAPFLILVGIAVPLLVIQVANLAADLPALADRVPSLLDQIQGLVKRVGIDVNLRDYYPTDLREQAATAASTWLSGHAVGLAKSTLSTFFNFIIIAMMSFYMVTDGSRLSAVFFRIIPENWHDEARYIFKTMDKIFYRWLSGVLIIGTIFAISTFVLMMVLGTPYALPIALIAGVLVIIPLFGDMLAIALPAVAAASGGSLLDALILAGSLAFIDVFIINVIISPRVVGNAVKLPILLVVIAVLLGSSVVGPIGGLLGVPVAALVYATTIAFADRAHGRTADLRAEGDEEEAVLANQEAVENKAVEPVAATVSNS